MTVERIKLRTAIVAAFVLAAAFAPASARAQDRPDFDHLARGAASAIDKVAKKGSPDHTAVLIAFYEMPGPASELGIELTKEFVGALRNHARRFHVVKPNDLKELAPGNDLPEAILSDALTLTCSKSEVGPAVLVEGFIEYRPDGVVIKVAAVQLVPQHEIFHDSQKFPISESMRQLMSNRAPSAPPFFTEEKKVWVNPDHPPVPDAEARAMNQVTTRAEWPNALVARIPHFRIKLGR